MLQLNGSRTHDNLKHAFAAESHANRRSLYFARAEKSHAGRFQKGLHNLVKFDALGAEGGRRKAEGW